MDEYYKINESNDSSYKSKLWQIAKGLQKVDGLSTSKYLDEIAEQNINNQISYDAAVESVKKYYSNQSLSQDIDITQREADLVSIRIVDYLDTHTFINGIPGLTAIHYFLFKDILDEFSAGKFRKHNIFKDEPILNGDTVNYGDYGALYYGLDITFSKENYYLYNNPLNKSDILHLSDFTSEIWGLHPFCEGNTRTIAVYIILYMKNKGKSIINDMFKQHSLYFRNALVRSMYENIRITTQPTNVFLNKFYSNMFLGTNYSLNNIEMQLPINPCYQKEIQSKLNKLNSNKVSREELIQLSHDKNAKVRKKAVFLSQTKKES